MLPEVYVNEYTLLNAAACTLTMLKFMSTGSVLHSLHCSPCLDHTTFAGLCRGGLIPVAWCRGVRPWGGPSCPPLSISGGLCQAERGTEQSL